MIYILRSLQSPVVRIIFAVESCAHQILTISTVINVQMGMKDKQHRSYEVKVGINQ